MAQKDQEDAGLAAGMVSAYQKASRRSRPMHQKLREKEIEEKREEFETAREPDSTRRCSSGKGSWCSRS